MNADPTLAVDEVKDLPSLIEFIGVLGRDWDACIAKDKEKPSSPYESMYGWENGTIGMFLDAMQAWSLDAEVQDGGNPHQLFARMLLAGKGYE
jgi:hypothetical protein